ncbi:MAG: TonB-dependent receptor [Phenylobacterium sp.]|uniref:TonB-dependent receptor n=2 Tax=Phenylobacterium sp. TaxID=1871053 RepID=UPI0025DDF46E|nr:TonB-dependent receptor [Phenylobacterium sp.]MCA3714693.1 TonB-dependent receptor [Phenylobacterium sp.]MCA3736743.1 TonB-dependent receptor [Phenylobacterium sp.]MCA6228963.1 TonB-dependent receptor [Phenylobacterium sp.]MCA6284300.1 TonB-dependent receptor [Phenylobacterium sp.]
MSTEAGEDQSFLPDTCLYCILGFGVARIDVYSGLRNEEGIAMASDHHRYALVSALLAGTMLSFPAIANAQPASAPPPAPAINAPGVAEVEATTLADVIVTAQRRAERLIDVPVSISTFGAEDIQNRGVTTLNQLQTSVPGLRIVDIGPGSQRIQLRGISQYLGLPTVGNYVDEFSVNNESASGSAEVRLLDMERVEVLRGPQPALYGEGSMGGTIRYVTASPRLDAFSGDLLGEVSSVADGGAGFRAEGILNIPLATDVAGVRIAAAREEAPGWTNATFGKDVNDQVTTTVRGKLLVRPSGPLTISLLGAYHESEQDVKSYALQDRRTAQVTPSPTRQRYSLGNLVATYDLGSVTLLSSTGYLDQQGRTVDDSARFYNQLFGAPLLRTALTDSRGTFKRFAQEFRLTSNDEGPLRYLVGASYSDADTTGKIDGNGESTSPAIPPGALGVVFRSDGRTESKVSAVFGSVSYDLTDSLTVDLGGRYFRDKRSTDSTFTLIGLPFPPSISKGKATFDTFNPRVNVSYKTSPNGIIYLNAAKGFRSGGFNQVVDPSTPATFAPEKLWSYELGARQSFAEGRLLVEAALYYNNYTNIQATIVQSGGTVAATRNAGKARGVGADITFIGRPVNDLSLSATLGWNDMKFKTVSVDRRPGDPLDLVPKWTWSLAGDYTPALNDQMTLILHGDIGHTDEAQITLRNLPPGFKQVEKSEARTIANLRVGVGLGDLELYTFADNLFDANKVVNPPFGAFFEPIRTRPRTIGVGVRTRF